MKAKCKHCGKIRVYDLEFMDDYVECRFCKKSGNLIEVL